MLSHQSFIYAVDAKTNARDDFRFVHLYKTIAIGDLI